jgi:hypothetical protein
MVDSFAKAALGTMALGGALTIPATTLPSSWIQTVTMLKPSITVKLLEALPPW